MDMWGMKRSFMSNMFIWISLIIMALLSVRSHSLYMQEKELNAQLSSSVVEVEKVVETDPVIVTEYVEKEIPVILWQEVYTSLDLTLAEIDLIAGVVHDEAGNQDELGKRLIVDVILNRLDSDLFPDTVTGVIYQKGQFDVVWSDRWETVLSRVTEEDYLAVYKEMMVRLDPEVIYFRAGKFSSYGKDLYKHGDHYFSAIK